MRSLIVVRSCLRSLNICKVANCWKNLLESSIEDLLHILKHFSTVTDSPVAERPVLTPGLGGEAAIVLGSYFNSVHGKLETVHDTSWEDRICNSIGNSESHDE